MLAVVLGLNAGGAAATPVSGTEVHKKSSAACQGARAKTERAARDLCKSRGGLVEMKGGSRCDTRYIPPTPQRGGVYRSTVKADVRCRRNR